MVLTKLRAVAFVKDKNDALVLQWRELFFVGGLATVGALQNFRTVALAIAVQSQA